MVPGIPQHLQTAQQIRGMMSCMLVRESGLRTLSWRQGYEGKRVGGRGLGRMFAWLQRDR